MGIIALIFVTSIWLTLTKSQFPGFLTNDETLPWLSDFLTNNEMCGWFQQNLKCEYTSAETIKTASCNQNNYYYEERTELKVINCNLSSLQFKSLPDCKFDTISILNSGLKTISDDAFLSHNNVRYLYLDGNQLQDIEFFDSITDIKLLSLKQNLLNSISSKKFKILKKLEYLDVSYNKITTIGNSSYILQFLQTLYINNNLIENLDAGVFLHLTDLRTLSIASNKLKHIPENIFEGLSNLQTLDLQGNTFKTINSNLFIHLRNLQVLKISIHNISLSDDLFSITNNLNSLYIINSKIFSLDKTFSKNIPSLRNVYVTNCTITNLCPKCLLASGIMHIRSNIGEQNNNLKFDLSNLGIEMLISASIINDNSMIKYLDFSNNHIKNLSSDSLSFISHIDTIRLNNNRIEYIDQTAFRNSAFQACDREMCNNELNLNNNFLKTLTYGFLSNLTNVITLSLNNNHIQEIKPQAFVDFNMHPSTSYTYFDPNYGHRSIATFNKLSLAENNISTLHNYTFSGITNLHFLILNDNQLNRIEIHAFSNLWDLKRLYLSRNKMSILDASIFAPLESLEILDISENKLTTLTSNIFLGLFSLHQLIASANKLKNLDVGTFQNLNHLHKLNIDNNQLFKFKTGVFSSLSALNILDISSNNFTTIDFTVFYPLHRLTDIDLDNNFLTRIDYESLFSHLPTVNSLSLNANLWECKFLTSMLRRLKERNVTFKLPGKIFEYNGENVDGIPCTENNEYSESNPTLPSKTARMFLPKSLFSVNLFKSENIGNESRFMEELEKLVQEMGNVRQFEENKAFQPTQQSPTEIPALLSDINKSLYSLLTKFNENFNNITLQAKDDQHLMERLINVTENLKAKGSSVDSVEILKQYAQKLIDEHTLGKNLSQNENSTYVYLNKYIDLLESRYGEIQQVHANLVNQQSVNFNDTLTKLHDKTTRLHDEQQQQLKKIEQVLDEEYKNSRLQENATQHIKKLERLLEVLNQTIERESIKDSQDMSPNIFKKLEDEIRSMFNKQGSFGVYINMFVSILTLSSLILIIYVIFRRKSSNSNGASTNLLSEIELSKTSA